ncbi:glycine--tRNA ligase [Candidatus Kaiserbacteria bacterium RIFCSPHIGHO2_01_FULL_49_13]|uniref:glycine--tRNA ligase n=1 Tax=Candidatus Kaiserbacteria bacterium RIFCSPHIGHO2_01_FULL_49_13 TaxID=1798477 RepID=A0A1F6CDT0_9BACT|nr:MAG: glycine--tRNA ligase [Candidatus Kaiserbacteria bacterium RIFCSPHIGHO2_01_FULL_49_13]
MAMNGTMEKIISLCKRRGFVFPGSDIYGGLAGTFDYGPLGVTLKNNIKALWWQRFVERREDMYGVDAAILMNAKVWEASGHVAGFADPLAECEKCKRRFRADHLEDQNRCPECGGKLGAKRPFNMMFQTTIGAAVDSSAVAYLRPETAQGIFVNFKNIVDSFHPKLPFGIAQIGKAFRNEIAPRDFIFRMRELEQMEIEYFVSPSSWQEHFEYWKNEMSAWLEELGFSSAHIHPVEVPDGERAHYSGRTIDFEYDFPFGQSELYGLAYRTDFDLRQHMATSGVDMTFADSEGGESFVPHIIEPSFGLDRTILALLAEHYKEDTLGGETRVVLALPPQVAPVKTAVFPLLKNKPELVKKAREIYGAIKNAIPQSAFDDNGNIGKRYRRQDEIGTPSCITIDFDTLKDNTVTLRDRDSGEQRRVPAAHVVVELGF